MSGFDKYIYSPEAVQSKMPDLPESFVEVIEGIEADDLFETVLERELDLTYHYQPNLFRVGYILADYLRKKMLNQEAAKGGHDQKFRDDFAHTGRYIREGLVIGNMAAMKNYGGHSAIEQLYLDISPETLAVFTGKTSLEIDMILDAIITNTQDQTAALHELIEYSLEMEDGSNNEKRQAISLSAVAAYSLLTYEQVQRQEQIVDANWLKHRQTQMDNEYLIASLPHRIRELKGRAKI